MHKIKFSMFVNCIFLKLSKFPGVERWQGYIETNAKTLNY